ncbi:MAG: PDZ domain-containing protein [Thermoplasmatales archaeon]
MIRYSLDLAGITQGTVNVVMEFPAEGNCEVVMPVWTPGSYSIRDFSRHIFDLVSPSKIIQESKNRWKVEPKDGRVEIRYSVFCDELSTQTSYASSDFTLLNGAGIFAYVEGRKGEACEVRLQNLRGKKVATGLDGEDNVLYSEDYDQLVDSPLLIGEFTELEFSVMGKQHSIAWHGLMPVPAERVVSDFKKIVEEEGKVFRDLPYKRYVFIIISMPDEIYGGLEHRNSTVIITNGNKLVDTAQYTLFLSTVSHEFFHTWNVKRIRPRELGPFDYTREVYTNLLWLSEGFTSYYEWLILWRAGIVTEEEYFNHLSKMIEYYWLQPGHSYPADLSSFNTWIKYYKPDGNILNAYVSYYLKGELIALALNCYILGETGGKNSLDDLFRAIYEEFKKNGEGIDKKKLIERLNQIVGKDSSALIAQFTEGYEEIDFAHYLRKLGYSLEMKVREAQPLGFIGLVLTDSKGKINVRGVLKRYPAFNAGILPGDEVVAVNGQRFTEFFTREISPEIRNFKLDDLKWVRPGEEVSLQVFRNNRLLSFSLRAVEEPPTVSLVKKEESKLKDKMLRG